MSALITGCNGFVGKYLKDHLLAQGEVVYGCDLTQGDFSLDLLDKTALDSLINELKPDNIYHLAGQSNVGMSWKIPSKTLQINAVGTLNLLEAVRQFSPKSRVLIIGSSEQYGIVDPKICPIDENATINPHNPYAISKATAEMYGKMYFIGYNIDIVMVRAFNHIGAGQGKGFVVPDFSSKIASIEKNQIPAIITVGNLDAIRDFTDVRDIVNGYYLLMKKGISGNVYNIGSGVGVKIKEILEILLSLSSTKIEVEIDAEKLRPSDLPVLVCNNTKIMNDTGWKRNIGLSDSLLEILNFWRESV